MSALHHIPEGWRVLKLSDITSKMRNGFVGKATDHYAEDEGSIAYVQGYNVKPNRIVYQGMKRISASFHAANPNSQLKVNDVLTTQTGEIGTSALVPNDLDGANCHALIISRFKKNLASPSFYSQFFNSPMGMRALHEISSGAILKHINVGEMVKLKVPVPPFEEQEAIADHLDTWDRACDLTERLIAAKQERRIWLMQQLLTGKRRLSGFEKKWKEVCIGDYLRESRIPGSHGKSARKITVKLYGLGVLPKTDVREGSESTKYYIRNSGQFIYSKLDFLNGAFGIVPKELDGYESTLDLPCFDFRGQLEPKFLLNLVSRDAFYSRFLGSAMGGRKARRVNPSEFFAIQIILPEIEEQQAIVKVIDTADRELNLLRAQLDALREQKKGLMQQLLTGKVRVKV